MHRIMLVDDEENVLNALFRLLRRNSWDVETYTDPEEALLRAQTTDFDLVLSDYRMPRINGVTLLTAIKEHQPESMRLILSGHADIHALVRSINQAEIYRFISKPWQDYELVVALELALQHRNMMVENRRLADQVREQQKELKRRKDALDGFAAKHPEILKVNWGSDGSVYLDDDDQSMGLNGDG